MRVIDQLRALFPGEWHYRRPVWEHEAGWNVYACAAYSPRWDCDDGHEPYQGESLFMASPRKDS